MSVLDTSIEGLKLRMNKVVADSRGFLYEMVPGGTANELLSGKIGNIYASKAIGKGVPRAGHFHKKLEENFFTLGGTVLWYFQDFREDSPTFGKKYHIIVGEPGEGKPAYEPTFPTSKGLLHVRVPPGVYHAYCPLTDQPALVVSVTSRAYDPSDYFDPIADKDSILKEVLGRGSIG